MLDNSQTRTDFFSKLTAIQEGDHPYVKKIKNKINKLLQQELNYQDFKD